MLRLLLSGLRTLSTVLRTALSTVSNTSSIECTANDVVTYTRKVLYTTTTYEYDAVLLQVVTFTRDVRVDLLRVSQTYTSYLTHS